jgi:hypothetical protein
MDSLTHSDSIIVARSPEDLYALVSDITNMGDWSPICKECWWEEDAGPRVGAGFGGRNELPEHTWETRSEVVAADPGREFAFAVHGTIAAGATRSPVAGGTEVTESWSSCPAATPVREWSATADSQIADRSEKARAGSRDACRDRGRQSPEREWTTMVSEWSPRSSRFRANGGKVDHGSAPLLILHTTGAKSGEERGRPLYRERATTRDLRPSPVPVNRHGSTTSWRTRGDDRLAPRPHRARAAEGEERDRLWEWNKQDCAGSPTTRRRPVA